MTLQIKSLLGDDITNAIKNGILGDIEVTFAKKRNRATLILIYAGIDAMAFLDMPQTQIDVTQKDFIRWVDDYIRFPGDKHPSGVDLYGARCALLHSYGITSRMSRDGKSRKVFYWDKPFPPIDYPEAKNDIVFISISALKEAFFTGVDAFLAATFMDNEKTKLVEARLRGFLLEYQVQHQGNKSISKDSQNSS